MYEDADQTLWLGGELGLYSIDKARIQLSNRDKLLGLANDHKVINMLKAQDQTQWVGTRFQGIVKINSGQSLALKNAADKSDSISGNNITAMLLDNRENIWISTIGNGLNRMAGDQPSFFHYRHDDAKPDSLGDNRVNVIFQSKAGVIWVDTPHSWLSSLKPQIRLNMSTVFMN